MDLEDTFYLVGIVYMIFMMLVAIAFLVVVSVIASKINQLQRRVNEKLRAAQSMADKVGALLRAAQYFMKQR